MPILDPKQGAAAAMAYGDWRRIPGVAVMSKTLELLNTDPLAQFAIGGLVLTIVVSVVLFAYVFTRRNAPRR